MGTRGGERESFRGNSEREKGERLHTGVQSGVRRFGREGAKKSATLVENIKFLMCSVQLGGGGGMENQTGLISQEHLKAKVITHALNTGLRLS